MKIILRHRRKTKATITGLIQFQRVERVGTVDFNAYACYNAFGGDRMLPKKETLTKMVFANAVLNPPSEEFKLFDFSAFNILFDVIKEILLLSE